MKTITCSFTTSMPEENFEEEKKHNLCNRNYVVYCLWSRIRSQRASQPLIEHQRERMSKRWISLKPRTIYIFVQEKLHFWDPEKFLIQKQKKKYFLGLVFFTGKLLFYRFQKASTTSTGCLVMTRVACNVASCLGSSMRWSDII